LLYPFLTASVRAVRTDTSLGDSGNHETIEINEKNVLFTMKHTIE
jgi:hypothetical protein